MKKLFDVISKHPSAKPAMGIVALLLVYTLTGFVGLPFMVKPILEEKLSMALDREAKIREVGINPFTLSFTAVDIVILDRDREPFFSIEELLLNIELSSIIRKAPVVKEFTLKAPRLRIVRTDEKTFNFSDLLEGGGGKKSAPPPFSVGRINITMGEIAFHDRYLDRSHHMDRLRLFLADLSALETEPRKRTSGTLGFNLDGSPTRFTVEAAPFAQTPDAKVGIDVKGLKLPLYLPYLPLKADVEIRTAELSTKSEITLGAPADASPRMTVSGTTTLSGLGVFDPAGAPLLKLARGSVTLSPSSPLEGMIHLSQILLENPSLNLTRDESGKPALLSLLPPGDDTVPAEEKKAGGEFTLDHLKLSGGVVNYLDLSLAAPFSREINSLEITLDNFSTRENSPGNLLVSASTELDERLNLSGTFSLAPFETKGKVRLTSMLPGEYSPFYEHLTGLAISTGTLDLSGAFRHGEDGEAAATLFSEGSFRLSDLNVTEKESGKSLLSLPLFSMDNIRIDPREKSITLGSVSSEKGILNLERSEGGTLNLEIIAPPTPTRIAPVPTNTSTPTRAPSSTNRPVVGSTNTPVAGSTNTTVAGATNTPVAGATNTPVPGATNAPVPGSTNTPGSSMAPPPTPKPWLFSVESIGIEDYTVEWKDLLPPTPARITLGNMEVRGTGLSTAEKTKGDLKVGFLWNGSGKFEAKGALGLSPLFAELSIGAEKIGIQALQPYIADRMRLTVTDGDFGIGGVFSIKTVDTGRPEFNFSGKASIRDFASVDRPPANEALNREPEDFLAWETLSFSGMNVAFPLLRVSVDGIALSNFHSRIVIQEDGRTNLKTIFKGADTPSAPPTAPEDPPETKPSRIQIDKISLAGGEIDFSDHLQKPGFSTTLKDINGSLTGLSSMEDSLGRLLLTGTHGNTAPLSIRGNINPLVKDPRADIAFSFKGIELPPFSPYSARYLGYKLHKGKLNLDLGYHLDKGKIVGENRILFDQFTLGEKVKSKDATSLPISLGISLLSDTKGRINIDLPVRGDLSDPEFSFGKMIFKALGNLLTKIITSPFAALGSMFGGGAELGHVEFEYGKAAITPAMGLRLEKLASALTQRPGLLMEIRGEAHGKMDRHSLLDRKLEKVLKGLKLDEMVRTGHRASSLSEIRIHPEEYESLVKQAFAASFGAPPAAPSLPVPNLDEMKQRIMARMSVADGDLRELAEKRAGAVKTFLTEDRKIPQERLFLLDPLIVPGTDKGEEDGNRVNFSMR